MQNRRSHNVERISEAVAIDNMFCLMLIVGVEAKKGRRRGTVPLDKGPYFINVIVLRYALRLYQLWPRRGCYLLSFRFRVLSGNLIEWFIRGTVRWRLTKISFSFGARGRKLLLVQTAISAVTMVFSLDASS